MVTVHGHRGWFQTSSKRLKAHNYASVALRVVALESKTITDTLNANAAAVEVFLAFRICKKALELQQNLY